MRTPLEETLIRVAYETTKPVLRREIVAVLKLADYPQEYIDWLQAKGPIFTNPSTGKKNKFLSLDSHSQAVVAEKMRPQYEKESKGEKPEGKPEKKESLSTSLGFRGEAEASEEDKVKWKPGDLDVAAPEDLEEKLRAQYRSQFENASYGQLQELIKHLEYALKNQDSMTMQRYQAAGYGPGALRKLRKMLRDKMKDLKGRLYTDPVGQIAQEHEVAGASVDAFYDWRKNKPDTGRKLSPEQLREKFIREAKLSPDEAQKVRNMSIPEFQEMYVHVLNADDVEEDEEDIFEESFGKMAAGAPDAESELVDAVEGEEDEEGTPKEDMAPKNILEVEEDGLKTASFREIFDLIVRSAYLTKNATERDRFLRMIKAQQDMDDDGDYDAEDDAGEDESLDEEEAEGTRPTVMAAEDEGKPTAAQIQFALDLSKEKGKDYTKSDLEGKSKAEVSALIEDMQKDKSVASAKQVSYALDLLKANGRSSPSKDSLEKMSEEEVSKLIDSLKAKKTASHSEIRDLMIRTAFYTKNVRLKQVLLRMLQAA